jgi:hypothetical protein
VNDSKQNKDYYENNSGFIAEHLFPEDILYRIAPSTEEKKSHNVIRINALPWACWRVQDICFEFDKALVLDEAVEAFEEIAILWKKETDRYKPPKIAIFGHADPVGKDKYNKTLSENRAKVIYAVLTRQVSIWKEVFSKKEEIKELQNLLTTLGYDIGKEEGMIGPNTEKAIQQYMARLCPGFKLKDEDFLGKGAAAYQGCSEFNPLRMFSKAQNEELSKPENHAERNKENEPNRRVIAFLWRGDVKFEQSLWPCPKDPNIADCEKMFWSDSKKRRSFQEIAREREHSGSAKGSTPSSSRWAYQKTQESFACRFYERLAHMSPCEQPVVALPPVQLVFEMYVSDHQTHRFTGEYKVAKPPKKPSEIIVQGRKEKTSLPQGRKAKLLTNPMKRDKYRNKSLEIIEERLHVMKKAKEDELTAAGPVHYPVDKNNIAYHGDFYPTERQYFTYAVYTDSNRFEKVHKTEGYKGGPGLDKKLQFRQNRILIHWDKKNRKVAKYYLDGEELDAEHDASAKPGK